MLVVAIAGCGGGDSTSSEATSSPDGAAPTPTSGGKSSGAPEPGAWGVAFGAETAELGIIIVDLSGHTLYTFDKDQGKTSTCYGACAKAWPPALTEGKPEARGEASPAKVGATNRKDGTVQLTYAGHPLYRYSGDKGGEIKGNDVHAFGGEWYAIRPNGEEP